MPDRTPFPAQAISDEIAKLYKTLLGRGPTRVSTTILDNLVVCVLEGTQTAHEATLLAMGAVELVRDARALLELRQAAEMVSIVERETGRDVIGHVPGFNPNIDVTIESFLLAQRAPSATMEPALPNTDHVPMTKDRPSPPA